MSELIANDPGNVLAIMHQLGCREADIAKDGVYAFSVRLDGNEVWTILDRGGRSSRAGATRASFSLAAAAV